MKHKATIATIFLLVVSAYFTIHIESYMLQHEQQELKTQYDFALNLLNSDTQDQKSIVTNYLEKSK